jgi:hypothetical protein
MSKYTLKQRTLTDLSGNLLTKTWNIQGELVQTSSVVATTPLLFTPPSSNAYKVDALLFEIQANVVPNWFGVAVPAGLRVFDKVNIFFHPTPGQVRRRAAPTDDTYQAKATTQGWLDIFRYVYILGFQLAAAGGQLVAEAGCSQVLIVPFLTDGVKDTLGIFAQDWADIVSSILGLLNNIYNTGNLPPVVPAGLVVSSFSAGIKYSDTFRKRANLPASGPFEIWDFDGASTTYGALSQAVVPGQGRKVFRYDQNPVPRGATATTEAASGRYHVPGPRWANSNLPHATYDDIHSAIPERMFYHAADGTTVC